VRYSLLHDADRAAAGWGEFYWIIDDRKTGPDSYLRLLPRSEAMHEFERLNKSPIFRLLDRTVAK